MQANVTVRSLGGASNDIGGFAAVNTGWLEETDAIGKLTGAEPEGRPGCGEESYREAHSSRLENFRFLYRRIRRFLLGSADDRSERQCGRNFQATQDFVAGLPVGFRPGVWGIVPDPS